MFKNVPYIKGHLKSVVIFKDIRIQISPEAQITHIRMRKCADGCAQVFIIV